MTKREKILELIVALDFEQLPKNEITNYLNQYGLLLKQHLAEDRETEQGEALSFLGETLRQRYDVLIEAVANIYDQGFEESDIDAMLAFYRSPTFARYDAVAANVINAMQSWFNASLEASGAAIEKIFNPTGAKNLTPVPLPPPVNRAADGNAPEGAQA